MACREGVPARSGTLRFDKRDGRMRLRMAGFAAVMATVTAPAWAQSQSDIVWPTYDRVERDSDRGLACPALRSEIAHVASDIVLLERAQTRVEDVLRSAFDMERYGGSNGPGGQRVSGAPVTGKEAYPKAREEIVASLRVAQKRRDHLKSLEPDCKPAPQPVSAP
jgi:hypothetical protein